MRTDPSAESGQSLVELLVALVALVPLFFGVAWVARVLDLQQATIAAARFAAFECTVRVDACTGESVHPALAQELRQRFFEAPSVALRSMPDGMAAPAQAPHRFRVDRTGAPLLDPAEDVTLEVVRARFDSPLAFAGGAGDRAFPGAVRVLSELGGPGRFGLRIEDGLLEAQVQARVARDRSIDDWLSRLVAMPLRLRARLTVLTDAWNASGPYGEAEDSVETRVNAGASLPGVQPAVDAAWLPVRGLLAVGAALGFESRAQSLRFHAVDPDRVPPDRLGRSSASPDPVVIDPNP
jgi:hypothetical protein